MRWSIWGRRGEGDVSLCRRVILHCRPGQAKRRSGIHSHREWFCEDSELSVSRDDFSLWLWVPAFAGMTLNVLRDRHLYILNNACRSIFPVPVFGNSSMKITSRGYL